MTYRKLTKYCTGATLLAFVSVSLIASPIEFTLDEAQSQIALSGSVLGNTLQEQGVGSLNTTFYGKILADLSASSILFPGGSTLNARTNGVWKPGPNGASGSAPADYAAQASTILGSVKGALRNLVLDVTSPVLSITNGQFNASELLFAFPTNSTASFDYDAGFLGAKGIALGGVSTNRIFNGATLTATQDVQTLTIQVDTEFKFKAVVENDSSVHLTGKLVATSTTLPSIASIQVQNQIVTLNVQGTGPDPRLDSSADLTHWNTTTPTRSSATNGVILTLPAAGALQFYRVAK